MVNSHLFHARCGWCVWSSSLLPPCPLWSSTLLPRLTLLSEKRSNKHGEVISRQGHQAVSSGTRARSRSARVAAAGRQAGRQMKQGFVEVDQSCADGHGGTLGGTSPPAHCWPAASPRTCTLAARPASRAEFPPSPERGLIPPLEDGKQSRVSSLLPAKQL